jgi:hypothetical protein
VIVGSRTVVQGSVAGLSVAVAILLLCGRAGASTAPTAASRTVTVVVSGPGTVSAPVDGLVCRASCIWRVGTEVTLTAAEGAGAGFLRWGGACAGTEGTTCTLALPADATVRAEFRAFTISPPQGPPPPPTGEPPPPSTTPPLTGGGGGDGDGDAPPPPTPAPTPAPPPSQPNPGPGVIGDDLYEKIDDAYEDLPWASVAFNAPETIGRGETVAIELLLSLRKTVERLKRQITEAGAQVGARVQVTDVMEARLTGTDFEILAVSPERQRVTAGEDTSWSWDVRPTQTGKLRLHVTLTGFLRIDGEREPRAIRTFDHVLDVRVTWFARISGFVEDNWQWLWTAILVPIGLWLARKRSKRHPPPATPAAPTN